MIVASNDAAPYGGTGGARKLPLHLHVTYAVKREQGCSLAL